TLPAKPLWQRAAVVAAGPLTNFLFAILILAGFAMAFGKLVAEPVIGFVEPKSVAQQAGLKAGDRVVSILGEKPSDWDAVRMAIAAHPGEPVDVVI
ncbi:M50 family metallopeptidase, partial [Acinetobacter baumannii]